MANKKQNGKEKNWQVRTIRNCINIEELDLSISDITPIIANIMEKSEEEANNLPIIELESMTKELNIFTPCGVVSNKAERNYVSLSYFKKTLADIIDYYRNTKPTAGEIFKAFNDYSIISTVSCSINEHFNSWMENYRSQIATFKNASKADIDDAVHKCNVDIYLSVLNANKWSVRLFKKIVLDLIALEESQLLSDKEHKELKKLITAEKNKQKELHSTIKELGKSNSKLKEELNATNKDISSLTKSRDNLKKEVDKLLSRNTELVKQLSKSGGSEENKTTIDELEEKVKVLTRDNATLSSQVSSLTTSLDKYKEENTKLKELVRNMEKESDKTHPYYIGYFLPNKNFYDLNLGREIKLKVTTDEDLFINTVYVVDKKTLEVINCTFIHKDDITVNNQYGEFFIKLDKKEEPVNAPTSILLFIRKDGSYIKLQPSKQTPEMLVEMLNYPLQVYCGYIYDIIGESYLVNQLDGVRSIIKDSNDKYKLNLFDFVVCDKITNEVIFSSDDTSIYEREMETILVTMWTPESGTVIDTDEPITVTNNSNLTFDYGDTVKVSSLTNNIVAVLGDGDCEYVKSSAPKKVVKNDNDRVHLLPLEDSVLIVGNNGYYHAYAKAFANIGVKAIVLNGYEQLSVVERAARKIGKVIITPGHLSHGNFWGLKDAKDFRCIVSNQGASSMVRRFKECFVG